MINQSEFESHGNTTVINKDNLSRYKEWGDGDFVTIDAQLVAAQKWQEMLGQTQNDGLERGVVVSGNGKKITTSGIILGEKGSFIPPALPHGFRSLLPTTKGLVYIHTHYMPPEISHVQTTAVSDTDINSFVNLSGKAMVMIDRGGVHVLARKLHDFGSKKTTGQIKVVTQALQKAKSGGNTAIDVVREVARSLEPFGIKYYYSEKLTPSSENLITLKDATKL